MLRCHLPEPQTSPPQRTEQEGRHPCLAPPLTAPLSPSLQRTTETSPLAARLGRVCRSRHAAASNADSSSSTMSPPMTMSQSRLPQKPLHGQPLPWTSHQPGRPIAQAASAWRRRRRRPRSSLLRVDRVTEASQPEWSGLLRKGGQTVRRGKKYKFINYIYYGA